MRYDTRHSILSPLWSTDIINPIVVRPAELALLYYKKKREHQRVATADDTLFQPLQAIPFYASIDSFFSFSLSSYDGDDDGSGGDDDARRCWA